MGASGPRLRDRSGRPIEAQQVRRSFAALLTRAELPSVRFHDLRHPVATLMLRAGIHPKIVADMLGHPASTITLDTHSHVWPDMQASTAAAMDTFLRRPGFQVAT